jgi:CRISPR-associated endonuclease/helicase Cas3
VLVVVNQVSRASALYRQLRAEGCEATLLHSRFTYADRARKEKQLAPTRGKVLVGTQAVEVSLDLDFDICFSELAPIESLLQRFGRSNRRGRATLPACVNLFMYFPRGESRGHLPYDGDHLARVMETLTSFLQEHPSAELNERLVQGLVDKSYPKAMADQLRKHVVEHRETVTRSLVSTFQPYGRRVMEEIRTLDELWEKLFDGEEILPETLIESARAEESWLGCARYLVPVSQGQFARLAREGRLVLDKDLGVFVARAHYDSEAGLELRAGRLDGSVAV